MGSLLLTPQTSGLGLTGQPKPTTSIKIAYKPSPGGDGPAGLKDVTLKITSSHTVAKAVDKVVKALATRYVQYGKADPADFALVLPSKTASKLGGGSPKAVDLERTASARSALSTMPASRNDARSLQLARRSLGHSDFCAQYAPASVSVACQASETAVETVLLQTSGDQSPWQLDGAALATELRLFRQRQRVTDPIARTADFFVADVADVQPEYPSGSLFKMSYQEKYQSLTASVRGLKDPVLSSLAEAVDDERESMIAAVSAVQRESQELRHGWLAETSKVERLLGCVASLLQDRDALFAALSNRGRMDAEYLVRHVNRQVNTRLSLHHAEVDVLRQRVEWHKARAAAVDTLQDALKSQPKAPPTPASTTEAQDEWTAERRAQDNEKLNATPRKPDKPVEGEPEGSVQRRLDHVIALLESKGPSSPRLDDARMDQHLLQRIKDLEDENDAMAQRVALFETKTTLLKSAQGLPLEAGDEARLLTERVVQLEGDLIREKDLRQQYAVQSEVIKQIGVQEILRQKEHITLQHTVLANAGLDIEQSMSPMRPSFPMFSHTQVPNRYLSKFQ
ncbi:hypothetical protein DIPPA_03962 [Diplonema papillatum]|nr:hypothetical protein DIPPA_03962 [Diplonema papillatum]